MQIILNIPDELASRLIADDKDPSKATLEALAVEGYRTERLTESEVRQVLGFETRMEVHAFLKDHGIYLHYSQTDADKDRRSAVELRQKHRHASESLVRPAE